MASSEKLMTAGLHPMIFRWGLILRLVAWGLFIVAAISQGRAEGIETVIKVTVGFPLLAVISYLLFNTTAKYIANADAKVFIHSKNQSWVHLQRSGFWMYANALFLLLPLILVLVIPVTFILLKAKSLLP